MAATARPAIRAAQRVLQPRALTRPPRGRRRRQYPNLLPALLPFRVPSSSTRLAPTAVARPAPRTSHR